MYKQILIALALVVPALCSTVARSNVIYEQSPDFLGGDGVGSSMLAGAQNADDFSLGQAAQITDISWWGSYDGIDSDSFVVRLFGNSGGTPGALGLDVAGAAVTKSDTGQTDLFGATIYQYDFHLPSPVTLAAGTGFLSVMNNTLNADWYWLFGNGGDAVRWVRAADTDAWTVASGDLAFRMTGTPLALPLPATLPLFGVGFASLAAVARRRR